MQEAGIDQAQVKPLEAYADQSVPERLDGAINQIIAPMVLSAEKHILENHLIEALIWKEGLRDLSAVATCPVGSLFYSWFKGVGARKN